MRVQYILSQAEVDAARKRLEKLKWIALISRDAKDDTSNREYYLRAKGFEDALEMLGLTK